MSDFVDAVDELGKGLLGLLRAPRNVEDPDDVAAAVAAVRQLQQRCDAALVWLATAAAGFADAGVGPIPEDVLSSDGAVPRSQVRSEIERARVLESFPEVAAAVNDGQARSANIDVLARLTARMTADEIAVLSEWDTRIATAAAQLGDESFRKTVSRMRDRIRRDGGATAAEQVKQDTELVVSKNRDHDMIRFFGLFDPIRGESIRRAIEREVDALLHAGGTVGSERRHVMAQALHDLVLRGDATSATDGAPRANVVLNVLVDQTTLESGPHDHSLIETESGLPLDPGEIGRLACECTLRRVSTLPDGNVHASRTGRSPTPAQRSALRALYDSCPISGAPWSQIEIHHVIFYSESKRTVLSELVPISRRWHHLIHDAGWALAMDADRTLHLSRPDGTHHRTIAPPVQVNQTHGSNSEVPMAA